MKDMIDSHGYNFSLIHSLVTSFSEDCLPSIPPQLVLGMDFHFWTAACNGQFSLKWLCNVLSLGSFFLFYKKVGGAHLPIKYSIFMWKWLNGFLGTDDIRKLMGSS